MEPDDEVKSGYLFFPPAGNMFKLPKKEKKKFCLLYDASNQGIERLEIYDNKEEVSSGAIPKIITLEDCIKITLSSPNTITILTKSHTQQISAPNENDTLEWVRALQSVAFKSRDSSLISCDEDNDLYCTSVEGRFPVKLCPTEASIRFKLEPIRYSIILTSNSIELRDINDIKLFATWPYKYIRRYRHERHGVYFYFEAGRKCDTGEGEFQFEYSNPLEIFKCIALKIKKMKQMMGIDNLNSPVNDHIEFNIQPSTSANLYPGSRSPLVAARPDDLMNLSTLSLKTASVKTQSTSSLGDSVSGAPVLMPKPALKPKPLKPPRNLNLHKSINKDITSQSDDSFEFGKYRKPENFELNDHIKRDSSPPSIPYDKIEVRSEAWKTLGIDDPDHTENTPNLGDNPMSMKLISKSQDNLNLSGPDSSRIILIPSKEIDPDDEDYDRLQYFGSTSKLNKSSVYKKLEARPTTLPIEQKNDDLWGDYDEIENVMQVARKADDSYLGYGTIRKPNTPGPQVPTAAQAQVLQNQVGLEEINRNIIGSEYAVVSRPKRV